MAAGVAHEINNPLTGVLTFTHLLLRRPDLAPEVRDDLQTVARETDRVRRIVKGLLDFSRQTRLEPEPLAVNGLVNDAVALVRSQALIKGVTLEVTADPAVPELTLDRNQIQSAVLNLLLNALDATAAGGRVAVSTRRAAGEGGGAPGVEIEVTDTGCGIPPEHFGKLFDPFFTTKDVGQGTGLGLSVAQGAVARHGGTIRVRSEVGRGSAFAIWLPVSNEGTGG
jgi:two-component system NtrC family sensor kinase